LRVVEELVGIAGFEDLSFVTVEEVVRRFGAELKDEALLG